MSLYDVTALAVEVGDGEGKFFALEGLFTRNFSLRQEGIRRTTLAQDPWERMSGTTLRLAETRLEFVQNNKKGAVLLQSAALNGLHILLKITLPGQEGTSLSGHFSITSYELFANDHDVLRAGIEARSVEGLS